MGTIRSFKDLNVWRLAMDLAMEIFEITKTFPTAEKFSLTDQLRRSSRSVPSNIAEAWRKRRYPAAFVSRLNDSEGEAAETQTHLEIARRCGYLKKPAAEHLDARYEEILAMLVTMASQPEKWVIRRPPCLRVAFAFASLRVPASPPLRVFPSPLPASGGFLRQTLEKTATWRY